MNSLPWFRLYSEMPYDERIEEIAYEDRWHYVNILCMKCRGVLDKEYQSDKMRERKISRETGLDKENAGFMKNRLIEVGLIDADWQPVGWDKRQYASDSSAERTRKYRENKKKEPCNVTETSQKRHSDAIDTEAETETEKKKKGAKRATHPPDNLPITDNLKEWAIKTRITVNLETETDKFLDWHKSHGKTMKDWDAGRRNWMRKAQEFAKDNPQDSTPTHASARPLHA